MVVLFGHSVIHNVRHGRDATEVSGNANDQTDYKSVVLHMMHAIYSGLHIVGRAEGWPHAIMSSKYLNPTSFLW